jgi:DNA polymerase I-like protein with 3'-5' exonuclease and polymerase domains
MKNPELIIIDAYEEFDKLKSLYEYLKDKEYIAYDTETTGLSMHDSVIGFSICAEETKSYYVIINKWNPELQKLVTTADTDTHMMLNGILYELQEKKLIMHNGVFDCAIIESCLKIRLIESLHTDTMILAHLLDENRRVGLKELATTMYGESAAEEQRLMKESIIANGGSVTKGKYELYKADPQLIARYGAKDALLTYKLFKDLVPELHRQKLDKFFYEDESMPLLRGPTYDLNTTGLNVDRSALVTLKKTLEAECLEAKAFVFHEIQNHIKEKYPGTNAKNTFNIDAPQQMSWLLFGQYKLEFGTLTKVGKTVCRSMGLKIPYTAKAKRDFLEICLRDKGEVYQPGAKVNGKEVKPKCVKDPWAYIAADKNTLKKLSTKYKWIERLLEYKRKKKLLTTYISALEEKTQYGVIQPNFLQHGTTGGRYACRNPNFQNLPRDDQRIKQCIVSRPGKVFVSADYSQLEPRVFSYYSQDMRLMNAFNGESDFYSVVGIEVFDKHDALALKEGHPNAFGVKYKKLRDLSKVIALASAYGATAFQLAPTTGKNIDDTAQDIFKYFERFPGVKKMMLEAHDLAKKYGYVTNLFGRPRRIPDAKKIPKIYGNQPHADLPYEARSLLNLACNHRIQSTGASIVNRAAIAFYKAAKEANIQVKLVLQVHDELITECDKKDAEDVKILLQYCMEQTTILKGIDLEAVPRITKNLAK